MEQSVLVSGAHADMDRELWSSFGFQKQNELPAQMHAEQPNVYVEVALKQPAAVLAVRRKSFVLWRQLQLAAGQSHDLMQYRVLGRLRMSAVT